MSRCLLPALVLIVLVSPVLAEYELEIGPDTTVIDGPLNPDGTINYLAYLNKKLSEGVTPENNFAVDVAMVMGENAWPSTVYKDNVFEMLSVDVVKADMSFTSYPDYLASIGVKRSADEVWAEISVATTEPWAPEGFPNVKQWLDDQQSIIDQLVSGSRKTKYYFPMCADEGQPDMLGITPFPWIRPSRGIGWALGSRAQLRLYSGDIDGAWADSIALRKTARLTMSQGLSISWLVGVSMERYADRSISHVASSESMTQEKAKRYVKELTLLTAPPRLSDTFNSDSRISTLDMVQHLWKGRAGNLLDLNYIDHQAIKLMATDEFDPNVTLRAINLDVDHMTELFAIAGFEERQQALIQYESELASLREQAGEVLGSEHIVSEAMARQINESNVTTAVATNLLWNNLELYSWSQADLVQTRYDMQLSLAPVALAIGGYHAEHGKYPPDLKTLVPAYLDSLSIDFATGELPVYRVEEGTAIIYSLGTNLKDDGGLDDPIEGDIVFRIER